MLAVFQYLAASQASQARPAYQHASATSEYQNIDQKLPDIKLGSLIQPGNSYFRPEKYRQVGLGSRHARCLVVKGYYTEKERERERAGVEKECWPSALRLVVTAVQSPGTIISCRCPPCPPQLLLLCVIFQI